MVSQLTLVNGMDGNIAVQSLSCVSLKSSHDRVSCRWDGELMFGCLQFYRKQSRKKHVAILNAFSRGVMHRIGHYAG